MTQHFDRRPPAYAVWDYRTNAILDLYPHTAEGRVNAVKRCKRVIEVNAERPELAVVEIFVSEAV
jgi:hypothetical protein